MFLIIGVGVVPKKGPGVGVVVFQNASSRSRIFLIRLRNPGSEVGLNECPFQRLRGYRKETKRTRGRLDMNIAPCSKPTTTVIDPLHECKKLCPCTEGSTHLRHSRMNQVR